MESGQSITQKELWDIVFWKPCNFSRKRPTVKGGRNWRPIDFLLAKVLRFSRLRRKSNKGKSQKVGVINKVTPIKKLKKGSKRRHLETEATTYFWRDPDANFCLICGGDEEGNHLEPMCPYNYLSPDTFSPCRARLLLWGSGANKHICSRHPEEAPILDEITLRSLEFLRCFVRVNNLPERCCPGQLVRLFEDFGLLRMWHVAWGLGYFIFRQREHAEKAISMLNCYSLSDCKLRVDWAYPCLGAPTLYEKIALCNANSCNQ